MSDTALVASALRCFGPCQFNLETNQLVVAGSEVPLKHGEALLLRYLALQESGIYVTRRQTLDFIYNDRDKGTLPDVKIIDVFLCRLRKKIAQASGGGNYILTEWRRGIRLEE